MITLIANPPAGEPRRHAAPAALSQGMTSAMAIARTVNEQLVSDTDWQQITDYLKDAA